MASLDISADVEALRRDLSALRSDIDTLKDDLMSELQNRAARASDGLSQAARSAVSSMSAAGERQYGAAVQQIEANPVTAVLVAAGIGLILGAMLRR